MNITKSINVVKMSNQNKYDDIEELVMLMMNENNHHPKDFSFRLITHRYPQSSHITFKFPGKFVKALKTNIFTDDGRNLEMDFGELVNPDGIITQKSASNVEHQSELPKPIKIDAMFDYRIGIVHENNICPFSIIITNIDPGEKLQCYESHGQIFYVYYIYVDSEEIQKRLSILTDIVRSNKVLSKTEALNFAYIAIFVKNEEAKEILDKLAQLFRDAKIMESELQMDLHHILKKIIKYEFDDENKIKELLTVITQAITPEEYEKLSSHQKTILDLEEQKQICIQQEGKIAEQQNENAQQKSIIAEQQNELEKKDEKIKKLENLMSLFGYNVVL